MPYAVASSMKQGFCLIEQGRYTPQTPLVHCVSCCFFLFSLQKKKPEQLARHTDVSLRVERKADICFDNPIKRDEIFVSKLSLAVKVGGYFGLTLSGEKNVNFLVYWISGSGSDGACPVRLA